MTSIQESIKEAQINAENVRNLKFIEVENEWFEEVFTVAADTRNGVPLLCTTDVAELLSVPELLLLDYCKFYSNSIKAEEGVLFIEFPEAGENVFGYASELIMHHAVIRTLKSAEEVASVEEIFVMGQEFNRFAETVKNAVL